MSKDTMDQVVSTAANAALALHARVAGEVRELCPRFPAPGILTERATIAA